VGAEEDDFGKRSEFLNQAPKHECCSNVESRDLLIELVLKQRGGSGGYARETLRNTVQFEHKGPQGLDTDARGMVPLGDHRGARIPFFGKPED
jgi:hypothetical protein